MDNSNQRTEPTLQSEATNQTQSKASQAEDIPAATTHRPIRSGRPPHRSWFRRIVLCLFALLLIFLLLIAALWVWSGRDGSLSQAISLAQRFVPIVGQALQVEDVQGSLRHGGQIGSLRWNQDNVDVQVSGFDLSWNTTALLVEGKLPVDHIIIDRLQVNVQPSLEQETSASPSKPPQNLQIPLVEINLSHWQVNTFIWGEESQGIIVTQSTGNYRYNRQSHILNVDSLHFAQGRYQAQASLRARNPLLDVKVQAYLTSAIPNSEQLAQVEAALSINGLLTELHIQADAQASLATVSTSETVPEQDGQAQTAQMETSPLVTPATPENAPELVLPQAHAQATIMLWGDLILPQAQVNLQSFNVGMFWPQAPQTALTGTAQITTQASETSKIGTVQVNVNIENSNSGPIDHQRLPIRSLQLAGQWEDNTATVEQFIAQLESGSISSSQGSFSLVTDEHSLSESIPVWSVALEMSGINPRSFYTTLGQGNINGLIQAQQTTQGITYNIELNSDDTQAASIENMRLEHIIARGSWIDHTLKIDELEVNTTYSNLAGKGTLALPVKTLEDGETTVDLQNILANGEFDLTAPGIESSIHLSSLTQSSGNIQAHLQLQNAQQTLDWIQSIPGIPAAIHDYDITGALELELDAQGGWLNPQVQASLNSPLLVLLQANSASNAQQTAPTQTTLINIKDTQISLNGYLNQATLQAQATAFVGQNSVEFDLLAQGGVRNNNVLVNLEQLNTTFNLTSANNNLTVSRPPALVIHTSLPQPVEINWQGHNGLLQVSPGSMTVRFDNSADQAPSFIWDTTTWQAGEINGSGHVSTFPILWLTTFTQTQLAGLDLKGDLMLEGHWRIHTGRNLDFEIEIGLHSGDITLEATGNAFALASSERLQAGVRAAHLKLYNTGTDLHAEILWDSEQASMINIKANTQMTYQNGGWTILPDAPLSGNVIAQLPEIGMWSAVMPTGWRLGGAAILDAELQGTLSHPQATGRLTALGISLRSVLDGIAFTDGSVEMTFNGNQVRLEAFSLKGTGENGGEITATGVMDWSNATPTGSLDIVIDRLLASVRNDRRVVSSGDMALRLSEHQLDITGNLMVNRALIILGDSGAPTLDSDVVIISHQTPEQEEAQAQERARQEALRTAAPGITPNINLTLNMGNNFRVQGYGLQTYLRGELTLTNQGFRPILVGDINTRNGRFRAYAQNLDIRNGLIRFSGAYDNPTLDILAIRPNISEVVGIKITGTASHPNLQVYSESGLSDTDALSWLILGRSSSADGTEMAVLQQAALALISRDGSGLTEQVASALGLDMISIGGSRNNTASSNEGTLSDTTVTIGKHLSDDFYVSYEQSLTGAMGTFYVFYDISRRLTLRAQAGEQSAIDIIYTFRFDGR